MGEGTLGRLFRRTAPPPPPVEAALRKLGELAEKQPDLADLAGANAALLRAMYACEPVVPNIEMTAAHARTKHAAGLPLLRGEAFIFDARDLQERFRRLCHAMQERGNEYAAAVDHAVKAGHLRIDDAAVEVVTGDPQATAVRADELGLDAGLVTTLLRYTLFPPMVAVAERVRPMLDTETWRRGYCLVCGSWPLLGEFRGLEQTRFLRCGLCAAEWQFDRLVCPFCDNRMHQDIKHWSVEGESAKHRAMSCERCHGYVKQITTLAPMPAPELLVADVATLHLDLLALERNYAPPA